MKDLRSDDGNCETGRVELTRSAVFDQTSETSISIRDSLICASIAGSERSVDDAAAAVVAVAGSVGNVDECAGERKIQDHSDEAQECDAAQAEDENECEDCVENARARDTLNGSKVGVDVQAMVV